jgi:hypothetical protein
MLQENLEGMQRATGGFRRRDVEAVLEDLDAEIELQDAFQMLLGGEAPTVHGHVGVRELIREQDELLAEFAVEYSEARDVGDKLVAIGALRARGKQSGTAIESPLATVSSRGWTDSTVNSHRRERSLWTTSATSSQGRRAGQLDGGPGVSPFPGSGRSAATYSVDGAGCQGSGSPKSGSKGRRSEGQTVPRGGVTRSTRYRPIVAFVQALGSALLRWP